MHSRTNGSRVPLSDEAGPAGEDASPIIRNATRHFGTRFSEPEEQRASNQAPPKTLGAPLAELRPMRSSTVGRPATFETPDEADSGQDFIRSVPARLSQLRQGLCALSRAQGAHKQQVSLAGLSAQCRWLSGYARTAGFIAASQAGTALEALCNQLHESPARLNQSTLRTLASGVDLLVALTSAAPDRTGRVEGARVLVLDSEPASRIRTLCALENLGITAIGLASAETMLGMMAENALDFILICETRQPGDAAGVCQAIRKLRRHSRTPIGVQAAQADWSSRSTYAMAGATEIIEVDGLSAELALKILGYFFRGRLSAISS